MNKPSPFVYAGLFLVCACMLISEILLTRVFSVCLWYHFAFFVISIAMFGLGLGGLYAQLFPGMLKIRSLTETLFSLALILALTSLISPILLFKLKLPTEIFHVFSIKTVLFLAAAFLVSTLPFFLGGLITSLLFKDHSAQISRLYFSDLAGAAGGCLLTIPLIENCGASNSFVLNACLGSLGALCFLAAGPKEGMRANLRAFLLVFLLLAGLLAANGLTGILDVDFAKGIDRRDVDEFSKWNSISRVSVTPTLEEDESKWFARNVWGISGNFDGRYPLMKLIIIDADAGTLLTRFEGDLNSVDYVRYDPPSVVYRLRERPEVLVIGPGGGKDVLAALSFGARHVTAVELNPIIVDDIMLGKYRAFSGGLYADPRVTAVADDGRSFIRTHEDVYDIIQLAFVDTGAATFGGAYALAENNLYTVESLREFLKRLGKDGIFSACYVDVPGLFGATRLIAMSLAALEEHGIADASRNIMVMTTVTESSWMIRNVLIKLTPFTEKEEQILMATCEDLGFEATYIPSRDAGNTSSQALQTFGGFVRALSTHDTDRQLLYDAFALNIEPATDDRPFFLYQTKPRDFFKPPPPEMKTAYGVYSSGAVLLRWILIMGIAMTGLFYVVPLVLSAWNQDALPFQKISVLPFIFYFSSIGLGYMMLEIVFLQRLLLFLGSPLYSLSITLASMLFFSGLGSLYTSRLSGHRPPVYIRRALFCLLSLALLYSIFLPAYLHHAMSYPKYLRVMVAILTLMPLGFVMGMPFPLAIKILRIRMNEVIPWMWGINGASSVLASIIAIILAMNVGYRSTLWVGCLFYLLALTIARFSFERRDP